MKLNDTTEIGVETFRLIDAEDGCLGCHFFGTEECEFPLDFQETCLYEQDGHYYDGIFVEVLA